MNEEVLKKLESEFERQRAISASYSKNREVAEWVLLLAREYRRSKKLVETYLQKTADGFYVNECEVLFCPKCKNLVTVRPTCAYCTCCSNPDDEGASLPLLFSECLGKV